MSLQLLFHIFLQFIFYLNYHFFVPVLFITIKYYQINIIIIIFFMVFLLFFHLFSDNVYLY